jgi:DNA replication and repair protein RecF
MYLNNIKLKNFRNYENFEIDLSPGINIIIGNNAQGKTNLAESIYFLITTKSHRLTEEKNLITFNKSNLEVEGKIKAEETISEKRKIKLNKDKKKQYINNNEIPKTTEYTKNLGIIIFFPEDLEIIKASPSSRRDFINQELSLLNKNYYILLNEYNKILKTRNLLLKEKQKGKEIENLYFEIVTDNLIKRAINIQKYRKRFIEKINENAPKIYKKIMGEDNFEIEYVRQYETENDLELKKIYKKSEEIDTRVGSTTIGPHKDDLIFHQNKLNLQTAGSQGQQRVAILSMKLAEIQIYEEYKKLKPIIILDDVFSELDNKKKNRIMKYLKTDNQIIITTTDLKNITKKYTNIAKIIEIKRGT